MSKNQVHIVVRPNVKDLLTVYCVEEYLQYHPEMRGKNITQSHILEQVCRFYLDSQ